MNINELGTSGKRKVKAQGKNKKPVIRNLLISNRKQALFYCWRRERDSNPRYGFPYTHFPGVLLQPLGHLTGISLRRWPRRGALI